MGLIKTSSDTENGLTVFTVIDNIDAEQLLSRIVSFLTDKPTRLALWDLRTGSLADIASRDLQNIVAQGKQFADSRKGGRTAIVCSTDLDFGLSRMFQVFLELAHVPFDFNVLRNFDEAREWLNAAKHA
jgi:hypothetical protein